MTPKEKAKELYLKMLQWETYADKYMKQNIISASAKQCALIAVDEIINSKELEYLFTKQQIDYMEFTSDDYWINDKFNKYWQKVKREIEKL